MPGDDVPCPVCRKIFSVPPGGMQDLLTNYFMNQLLQLNETEMAAAACKGDKTFSSEMCLVRI